MTAARCQPCATDVLPVRGACPWCDTVIGDDAPGRATTVDAARRKRQDGMHRWGDVKQPIVDWTTGVRYPAMRLAEASGVPEATVRRTLAKHDDDPITPELLTRLTNGISHRTEGAA